MIRDKGDDKMNKPVALKKGDKVALVSLSSGILGEDFCKHQVKLGIQRLQEFGLEPIFMPNALKGMSYIKENPKARAEDLKQAFYDDHIKGIICVIGGDDTYTLLPFLMEDYQFIEKVKTCPKLFTGFSDTTINHLMFYKLGIQTFYGPNFLCDLAELGKEMIPYTKNAFESYFTAGQKEMLSSPIWYEERTDFSAHSVGIERTAHEETRGYEVLQGEGTFRGRLLGGCLESLYDMLTTNRYEDQKEVCEKYGIFPSLEKWKGKVLFLETCEEKPAPEKVEMELNALKERGIFEVVNGILVGKPQDEAYYEEYKAVYKKVISNKKLPILYNVNFGHSTPRGVLPYGSLVEVDLTNKKIVFKEDWFKAE